MPTPPTGTPTHHPLPHSPAHPLTRITTHPFFTNGIIIAIIFVAIATGLETDNSTDLTTETFAMFNFVALLLFTFELVLKVGGGDGDVAMSISCCCCS